MNGMGGMIGELGNKHAGHRSEGGKMGSSFGLGAGPAPNLGLRRAD
jgi:hypothetical protein